MDFYHCLYPRISLDGLEIAETGGAYYADTCCQTSASFAETFPRYSHVPCCACVVVNVLWYVIRDLKQLRRGRRRERPEVIFHLFFGVRMSEISFSFLWRCRGRQVSVFFVVVRT